MKEKILWNTTKFLLTARYGSAAFDFWFWEMTPMPIGRPFISQYWQGILWAITPGFIYRKYFKKS
jgi:hypothetical protein